MMENISPEALRLVTENAPDLLAMVRRARRRQPATPVTITLDRFRDDPLLLYAAVWYSVANGIEFRRQGHVIHLPILVECMSRRPTSINGHGTSSISGSFRTDNVRSGRGPSF